MKLSEIQSTLNAQILTGEDQLDKSIMAAGGADLMEDILAAVAQGSVLLTGLTTENVLQTAIIAGVGAVVFVRGKHPGPDILELSRSYKIPLLVTHFSLFVACGRLYMNGLRGLDGSW